MSNLTKVLALLVSALAIFLCGVVVVFFTNTSNYKTAYEQQITITMAAQVNALAANMELTEERMRNNSIIRPIQENIGIVQRRNSELARQIAAEKQSSATEAGRAEKAIGTMMSFSETIQNMRDVQLAIQRALDEQRAKAMEAETQRIELTRQFNNLQAENNQLIAIRKQQVEKIYELEEENSLLKQDIGKVELTSGDFKSGAGVSMVKPERTGVPIRGEVTGIDGEKAAVSVGSSSGVRKGMMFSIVRGANYLGKLEIIFVTPSESVGRMVNLQGIAVPGDSVTTGFD